MKFFSFEDSLSRKLNLKICQSVYFRFCDWPFILIFQLELLYRDRFPYKLRKNFYNYNWRIFTIEVTVGWKSIG